MPIDFDPAKNARNIIERGLSFELAWDFEVTRAVIAEDLRHAYPERRWIAVGPIRGRLHEMVSTPVAGRIRIISLRKANDRERKQYEAIR